MAAERPDKATSAALRMDEYTYDVLRVSKAVFKLVDEALQSNFLTASEKEKIQNTKHLLKGQDALDGRYYLTFKDIQHIHKALERIRVEEGISQQTTV
jgi:hypothetical protein